jgi:hypothetical protein
MNHKGADYTLTRSETPGFWQWQFRIGNLVRSGKTEARLFPLAMRRVQLRIDRTEARDAPIDLVIGIRAGYFPASLRTFQVPHRAL